MNRVLCLLFLVVFPGKTPDFRGLAMNPLVEIPPSHWIAASNSNSPDEKGNSKKQYDLLILPCPSSVRLPISPSYTPLDEEAAGNRFSVAILVVDGDNRIADADGLFRFTWSSHNYIDPSNPRRSGQPINTHWDYEIENGMCLIPDLHYDECGSIVLTGMARVRTRVNPGTIVLQGTSATVTFFPHHYELTVDAPPGIRGSEVSYTYAGQPVSATVSIQAFNANDPPESAENYDSATGSGTTNRLAVSLVLSPASTSVRDFLQLSYTVPPITFSGGQARILVNPLSVDFTHNLDPQTLSLRFDFQDARERTGSATAFPIEYRLGRVRIHNRIGILGELQRIFIDLDEYRNEDWQLNSQEEVLRISAADLQMSGGSGTVSIRGSGQFFAGKIRGGDDPLRVEFGSANADLALELTLSPASPQRFLRVEPGRWQLYMPGSPHNHYGRTIRNRVLYEKEL